MRFNPIVGPPVAAAAVATIALLVQGQPVLALVPFALLGVVALGCWLLLR